jgi:ABC-2 type transport system ATP-binding protein
VVQPDLRRADLTVDRPVPPPLAGVAPAGPEAPWAVELDGVSKAFVITRNAAQSVKVKLIGLVNPRYREHREEFWALRNVTLMIRPGESVGLIGRNGSGKSTLLRIIAGIFPPTQGTVRVHGRVAPMIEVGVGFHPDLSGRENVYLNAALFRLSRRETDAVYRQIVEFAELEPFMDLPVKNYSTGMYGRLGFATAVHLAADVLLIDEVLAVGDESFQQKCLERMEAFRKAGHTIVFVSHSAETVQRLCDRAVLLVHGRLEADGEPAKVIEHYRELTA